MRQIFFILILILTGTCFSLADENPPLTEDELAFAKWANELVGRIESQKGRIELPNKKIILDVPDGFVYLSPKMAKIVMEEAWSNPPSETSLGILMPEGVTPFDDNSWAVTIEYEEDGYVSDDDAETIDYDEMLGQLKEEAVDNSRERVEQGYEKLELIGWAAAPYYDKVNKKLHWAKEYKFGDREVNTLNYNIRILGREGVLLLNFIADISQLPEIDVKKDTVMAMASFNTGFTYADFDPSIDKVAAYGIGALIAGKVLLKTGFLVTALIFLKKFGIIIVIAVGGFFVRMFKRRKSDS